ncbi:hypothetical protein M3589_11655 [Heyndrickxia oleronia]|uniref:Uncharacterized protein n=2 Tax=Bacillaceae TaxID=186817 RepID=A0AAW6SR80_9BACI|nr:hypothetical protein [Heyndrickxia oleronia]MCM3238388.1 hypothetical protein [Heyndrickxia oleronia]MDH5161259.1 hypothetical protein [Heyndrickxia oleronia]
MVKVTFLENDEKIQVPNYKETIHELLQNGSTAIFPNLYEYDKLSLNLDEIKIYLQKQY